MGKDRKSWLAFCSGVDHARHVAEEFGRQGITCRTIFGDTPKDERDAIIAAFKRGEIRALASMGVLTTGFNAPAVDLIALLRPTQIGRALCADGRSWHAAGAGQGELPRSGFCGQCPPPWADRSRASETSR